MSLQVVLAAPTSVANAKHETNRRSADFHPSVWGDYFLSCASDSLESDDNTKLLELKGEIIKMLMDDVNKPSQKLGLIDAVQRLGVSYHFETEVDEILEEVYKAHNLKDNDNDDLYSISLEFRLLRQHGYNISCDVFNKFKDSNGNFNSSLEEDIRGILSLYEATHLRVHGESILDEALAFTTSCLESMAAQLSTPLAAQVKHALNGPIRKGLQRVDARHHMTIYQEEASHNEVLLTFAKLDFNILQKMHQKEIRDITRWWKDLDFAHKLPFARDRVVECYFWTFGMYFEPEYFLARRILTKVTAMTSILDDIYDLYGTIEELELFTSAIERWHVSAKAQLPEYMKLCYEALLDVYSETEEDTTYQGKLYRLHYAKEAMKTMVRNYFEEAKWCHKKYVPTMDEYMTVASVTSVSPVLATTSFVGMGDIVTKEAFEWLFSNPKMVKASSIVGRLMNDLVSHKSLLKRKWLIIYNSTFIGISQDWFEFFNNSLVSNQVAFFIIRFERKRDHVASSIECFMKQHGATEDEARNELQKEVTDAWKDINEECLHPTAVPMPLLDRILNLARVTDVVYKEEDGYTNPQVMLKDLVASLFINPVPI